MKINVKIEILAESDKSVTVVEEKLDDPSCDDYWLLILYHCLEVHQSHSAENSYPRRKISRNPQIKSKTTHYRRRRAEEFWEELQRLTSRDYVEDCRPNVPISSLSPLGRAQRTQIYLKPMIADYRRWCAERNNSVMPDQSCGAIVGHLGRAESCQTTARTLPDLSGSHFNFNLMDPADDMKVTLIPNSISLNGRPLLPSATFNRAISVCIV